MRKLILILAAVLMAALPSHAQKKTSYTLTRGGKDAKTITWTVTQKSQGIDWHLTSGNDMEEYYTINAKGETTKWRHIVKSADTDLTITRSGDVYTYSGKFKGKDMDKTVKSKGNPWFQNIELNILDKLGNGKFQYECIRPTEADLHVMTAENKGIVDIEGFKAYHVRSTVGGAFAGIWGCSYYFDSSSKEFVVYKAVEGGPGTPETKIVRKK